MKRIPDEFLKNQSFQNRAIAFDDQMPINLFSPFQAERKMVPPGTAVQPDGSVKVTFYAPDAKIVTAFHDQVSVELVQGDDGVWSGVLPYDEPGFKQLGFKVDGTTVLNALAPIGFGSGRPINYVEVPDTDCDFLLCRDVPHGSITHEIFKSKVTGQFESCLVYTPPGYQQDLDKTYPVVYLQHGGGENEMCWVYQGKVNYIMDNLLAAGQAVPALIVMNNGMVQVDDGQGGRVVNSDKFQDLLLEDCIPMIESRYRVKTGQENRAISGLSMGSLQSGRIIMEHPELFIAAGLFTGFLPPRAPASDFPYLKALDNAESFNKQVKLFFRAMGDQEPSIPLFASETKMCDEKGIRYVEKIYPGHHEWRVWRNCAHDFLKLVFR
jgi:enterochelin esterase-like enzyme